MFKTQLEVIQRLLDGVPHVYDGSVPPYLHLKTPTPQCLGQHGNIPQPSFKRLSHKGCSKKSCKEKALLAL